MISFIPYIIALIILILFFVSKKFFSNEESPISPQGKTGLVLTSIIIITALVISYGYTVYGFYRSDTGYTQAAQSVGFKVLQPSYLPSDFLQVLQYELDENLYGGTAAVKVSYSPLKVFSFLQNKRSPILVINQADFPSSFDLKLYLDELYAGQTDPPLISSIVFANANEAYQMEATSFPLNGIFFITSENTVVAVLGTHMPIEELIKVAESLE
ncbi:MAG: hypothetical protein QG639_378 [Patescibacteria group bacterium]|nr:hypothetical protein [Patescibacteria group bacterium]